MSYYSRLSTGAAGGTSAPDDDNDKQQPAISIHYRLYSAEKKELEIHKWLESEKAGYDIGMEHARIDWCCKHRAAWLVWWLQENAHLLKLSA